MLELFGLTKSDIQMRRKLRIAGVAFTTASDSDVTAACNVFLKRFKIIAGTLDAGSNALSIW